MVMNNGIGYSTTSLNTDDAGTYALFEYKFNVFVGSWMVKNVIGYVFGGVVVEIMNLLYMMSMRLMDNNFFFGVYLRCRFGNLLDASAMINLMIGMVMKMVEYLWFGCGGNIGYIVMLNCLNGGFVMEGLLFILRRGTTYTFTVSLIGYLFYLFFVELFMWEKSNMLMVMFMMVIDSGLVIFVLDFNMLDYVFYYSISGAFMGGMIIVVDLGAVDFEIGVVNVNMVCVEWVLYNKICCIVLMLVSVLDDNVDYGGN